MPEAYGWPDGNVYISTGNAFSTSALLGYCQNTNVSPTWGWYNQPASNGVYFDHLTGKRCDASIQQVYTFDKRLIGIAESATAIHLKFIHSAANGTGGIFLYSGRIDNMAYAGAEGQVFTYSVRAHFNNWSAF